MTNTGDSEVRAVGTPPKPKPKSEPQDEAETPLPSTEDVAFASDVSQEPAEKSITFGARKYLCHPAFPVRRFTKIQSAVVGLADQRGKTEDELKPEDVQRMLSSIGAMVDVLEVLVVPDAWPELLERIDTNDSPHGTIQLPQLIGPVMSLFGQYGERAAGKP